MTKPEYRILSMWRLRFDPRVTSDRSPKGVECPLS